ncbi:MAG: M28 family peptidase [Spirochaetales bacterium]|nr:M28 family peptidase [Spirochaetales bacterium]MCF7937399.1 M28 family peptidase [Spirochaetales bacterium]
MSAHEKKLSTVFSPYRSNIDIHYGYRLATDLSRIGNSSLGGRQAGSRADREATRYLHHEMNRIGLSKVRREAFPVDSWEFRGARLTITKGGGERTIYPYSYASGGTDREGITGELIYAGKGRRRDYENLNVRGKIVLIDIDMENDWWINYPSLEAAHQGAAALINNCVEGYGQYNDRTMNTQDFCGPVTIPSVNVSRADAEYLKGLIQEGNPEINLQVDNEVKPNGTSWNIVGEIPGETAETRIIVGDHHDCHFYGFQDNNTGVAAALTIAKAMIDSDYRPYHTLIFVLHGAEEWGAIDNRYDWQVGAWHQIHTLHPEWIGSTLAFINFEMPGMAGGERFVTHATPEFHSFLQDTYRQAEEMGLEVSEQFAEGFGCEDPLLTTWSDAWTYASGGIPSFENYAGYREGDTAFSRNIYHSNYDTPELFQSAAFDFNVAFYGLLAMVLDRMGLIPLDFRAQADRIDSAANYRLMEEAAGKPDVEAFKKALSEFREAAAALYEQTIPAAAAAAAQGTGPNSNSEPTSAERKTIDRLRRLGPDKLKSLNRRILEAFGAFQDGLVRLDWEDSQAYRFEQKQRNIPPLEQALRHIESGNREAAAEALSRVDNNAYALYFSRPVVQHEYEQIFGKMNEGKLFWGTGKLSGYIDFYDAIASLQGRSPEEYAAGEFVSKNYEKEKQQLKEEVQESTQQMEEVTEALFSIVRDTNQGW